MIKLRFMLATLGLALLLMASPAEADISVTLSSGGSSETLTTTGTASPNQFAGFFSVGGYNFTIQTAFTTPPASNGGVGELESTSIVGYATGATSPLTVTVQDINPNGTLASFGSSTPSSYSVQNAATLTSPTAASLMLVGSAQIDAANQNVATIFTGLSDSTSGAASNSQQVNNVAGYTLAQTYTLSMLSGNTTGLTVGFNTSVTPTFSPAAVPEPSSLVLTGLAAIGLGGFAFRRHMRARSL
jgi:PEP-CTERM motif